MTVGNHAIGGLGVFVGLVRDIAGEAAKPHHFVQLFLNVSKSPAVRKPQAYGQPQVPRLEGQIYRPDAGLSLCTTARPLAQLICNADGLSCQEGPNHFQHGLIVADC